jgi:hypothetical protein
MGFRDAIDDVIGPIVNKPVKVQVVREHRGTIRFQDIELDD